MEFLIILLFVHACAMFVIFCSTSGNSSIKNKRNNDDYFMNELNLRIMENSVEEQNRSMDNLNDFMDKHNNFMNESMDKHNNFMNESVEIHESSMNDFMDTQDSFMNDFGGGCDMF